MTNEQPESISETERSQIVQTTHAPQIPNRNTLNIQRLH